MPRYRVNVNGTIFEDRWDDMAGAAMGAMRRFRFQVDHRDYDEMAVLITRLVPPPGMRDSTPCRKRLPDGTMCGSRYRGKAGCERGHPGPSVGGKRR